ncbi:hypothetical protein AMS68_007760 [Peltaster fructicola]|uniref:Uncharacterized protein n=1 Tax=Peltaster fructicola TaxID=286661 RepID=A0A6H0Y5G9_9PEZI|nr:hypothetical protein AMS68_007760 [Peltaster fructicola]
MALHRGIQSAIFYYVSCAPCAEARVRKRRKQEAERDRLDREVLEAHIPGLYRQPDPSSTNPYWQAEIDAGPVPLRTRKRQAESSKVANSTRSNIASSVSVNASALSMERSDSAKSGLEQFQRQDEVLWGAGQHDGTSLRPPSARRSSHGLPKQPPRARVHDQTHLRTYQHMQNAAINDLHPPTTRKVHSKDEVSWMMQPPPLPEVMNGKAMLHRGSSNASRPSAASSRRLSDRGLEVKDDSAREHNIPVSSSTLQVPRQAVYRSNTLPLRPPPPEEIAYVTSRPTVPHLDSASPRSRRITSRTPMSNPLADTNAKQGSENDEPHRAASFNSALPYHGSRSPAAADEATISSTRAGQNKWLEKRMVIPRRDSLEDLGSDGVNSPENFDAWRAPEFELPEWIHEHTKREVRQRWSFDM